MALALEPDHADFGEIDAISREDGGVDRCLCPGRDNHANRRLADGEYSRRPHVDRHAGHHRPGVDVTSVCEVEHNRGAGEWIAVETIGLAAEHSLNGSADPRCR